MGGPGGYDRDVSSTSSTRREDFSFTRDTGSSRSGARIVKEKEMPAYFDPKKAKKNGWECLQVGDQKKVLPIALMIDGTLSRGDDVRIAYAKIPLLMGQIVMHDYAHGGYPEVSICAVGDFIYDKFPVQISDFESDERIDRNLKEVIIEEGGGGNGFESYATAAFGYARYSFLDINSQGKKGYMFILGDEQFYPKVKRAEIKSIFDIEVEADIPSKQIFAELQKKYHVFFVYVAKSQEERKKGIDAEIKKRVKEAGGMYDGVDIRASLMWNNRNDLDLHCLTPGGTHIFFGSYCKSNGGGTAPCGGFLDVDKNVQGETVKPVENIRWAKGKGKEGRYVFWVENYRFHESRNDATWFRAEIEVNGEVQTVEGEVPAGKTGGGSKIVIAEIDYDTNARKKKTEDKPVDPYAAYADDVVLSQWRTVLPEENVLVIDDAKAIADVMLGAIALTEDKRTLEQYDLDLEERGQTAARRNEVRSALSGLSLAGNMDEKPNPAKLPKKKKK